MKTLAEFLDKHNACTEGIERAKAFSSLDDAWNRCEPSDMFWLATRPGVLTEKELRLFAVFCARHCEHLLTDDCSRAAIDIAERHAHGKATDEELHAAYSAAYAAARAARAAADAAYYAARAAAGAVAVRRFYEIAAADADAYVAARAAAGAAYSDWIRENTTPNFS